MMFILALFLLVLLQAQTMPSLLSWDQFKTKYQLTFSAEEERQRRQIYQQNVTQLMTHPCRYCGITKFFAYKQSEIQKGRSLLMLPNFQELAAKQQKQNQQQSYLMKSLSEVKIMLATPSAIDWRESGAVTPAKAQGTCGTCWSFATVAMCESSLILQGRAINNKIYQVDLSQQYLLKCTDASSCSGGYLENAIDKALKSGLPYQSEFGYDPYSNNIGICYTKNLIKVSNKTRVSKYHIDDSMIMTMLQDGPVVAAVSATGWEKYSSGVFSCTPNAQINHAVMIVGYAQNYWIIKNSWGVDFGVDGFIYVSRDRSSNCGIGTAIHELSQHIMVFSIAFMILIVLFSM